jgi:hypothetical protein
VRSPATAAADVHFGRADFFDSTVVVRSTSRSFITVERDFAADFEFEFGEHAILAPEIHGAKVEDWKGRQ